MGEKIKKLDLQKLLIAAAIIIAVLICYMCVEKVIDNKNVAAYEAKIVELQQTIGRLYQEMYLGSDEAGDADEADGSYVTDDEDYWYNAWSECNERLDSLYYADEDITDTMAKILFIRGVNRIWAQNISDLIAYPVADPRVTTEVDGKVYIKRDVLYADVVKEYSRIFTGDLLEERLNERFIEIDGYLYVSAGGGDLGETVGEVEVTKVSESNGELTYSVKYNLELPSGDFSEEYRTATIVIKSVGNSFAISSLEFDEVEEETTEPETTEESNAEQDVTEQEATEQDNTEPADAE